ncbi:hypothetical protein FEDK69T_28020 [Flavobacterium enshiense DK69]|nr:hypothetical protein FEDK69T_28020 [Flavobacterium enshiense DK69]
MKTHLSLLRAINVYEICDESNFKSEIKNKDNYLQLKYQ